MYRKGRDMKILMNLSSRLMNEVLSDCLKKDNGSNEVHIANNGTNGVIPDIILVDANSITPRLFSLYPGSKHVLFDTGLKQEDIISIMLSYKIDGIISAGTDLRFFKKALGVIREGQLWVENSTIKAILQTTGCSSRAAERGSATEREYEIIEHVCQGCSNKEIASKLSLSEQTVKAHMNRIFRKFHVTNRFQLITLAHNNRLTT